MMPFRDGNATATFQHRVNKVIQEIHSLDNEYVLKASEIEMENYYIEQVTIQPLVLHTDHIEIEKQAGTQINVSNDPRQIIFPGDNVFVQGTNLEIAIPFEGDQTLWNLRPSSFSISGHPKIDIRHNRIILNISFPDDDANSEKLKAEIDRDITSLKKTIESLHRDVTNHIHGFFGLWLF